MKKYFLLLALTAIVPCCMAQISDSVLMKNADAFFFDSKEYSKAYPIYRQLADKGNARAQRIVAYYFHYGLEPSKVDFQEAFIFYSLAADKGDKIAQAKLGDGYYTGDLGLEIDYAKAFEWYKKSAAGGYDEAMIQLGLMYAEGQYVQKNGNKARDYYMQAINKTGNERAMLYLGNLYKYRGVDCDGNCSDQAIVWYKRAAEKDSTDALRLLADLYDCSYAYDNFVDQPTNYGEYTREYPSYNFLLDTIQPYADNLWLRAAQNGSGEAQAVIGFKCFVEKRYDEALQWYEKAKKNGAESVFRRPNVYLPLDIAVMLCDYFRRHQESNFYFVNYRISNIFESTPEGWTIWVFPDDSWFVENMYHWYIPSDFIIVTVEKNGKFGLVKLSKEGKVLGKTPVMYDCVKHCFDYNAETGKMRGVLNGQEVMIDI